MSDTPKRFEDWEEVDCNECERWWLNQCDGASKGSTAVCNSFLATRKVVIPEKIKRLEMVAYMLSWLVGFTIVVLFILIVGHIMGWL